MTGNSSIRVIFQLIPFYPQFAADILTLPNGTLLYLEGSYVNLMWDIKDALNLSVEMDFEPEYDWAVPIHKVANGTADVCAISISQSEYWKEAGLGTTISFLHAVISDPQYLFYRQPVNKDYPSILLRPFQYPVWITILILFGISIILIKTAQHIQNWISVDFGLENYTSSTSQHTKSDIFMQGISLILGRTYISSSHDFTPIHLISSVMLASFLTNLYTAKVISTFANDDGRLVKNYEDLIEFGYTFCTWHEYSFDRVYHKSLQDKLHKQKFLEVNMTSLPGLMNKVISPKESGKYVMLDHKSGFYISAGFAQLELNQDFCSVMTFVSPLKYPRAMIIKKESPLREKMNFWLLQLNERGLKARHYAKYLERMEYKCISEGNTFVEISNEHVLFAYCVIGCGIVMSILIEVLIQLSRKERFSLLENRYKIKWFSMSMD